MPGTRGTNGAAGAAAAAAAAAADRPLALLGFIIWTVGAVKAAPVLPLSQNLQTLAGSLATLLVGVAWPAWHPSSYLRWRTAALGSFRLFIIALPVNYNPVALDGLAHEPATSRFSWMPNASHLLMGTHVGLLAFCALLFRLPLRAHLRVQSACVAILLLFGVHTHCQSRLFKNSMTKQWFAFLHDLMAALTALFAPITLHLRHPTGPYAQSAAALIFLWLLLGWLVPTLLLIVPQQPSQHTAQSAATSQQWHEQQRHGQQRRGQQLHGQQRRGQQLHGQQQHGQQGHRQQGHEQQSGQQGPRPRKHSMATLVERFEAAVERSIRLLLPGQERAGAAGHSTRAVCGLSWLVAVNSLWLASCGLAMLYDLRGEA